MQFMLIFNESTENVAERDNPDKAQAYWAAWGAYVGALNQSGLVVSGAGLQPPHTATHIQVRDGKRHIHDGPYADTKEHLGGFFIIDVPSLDEALEWASRSPNVYAGTTEVRPVLPPPV